MEEKFLYHIWDAGHLAESLKTVSGKELKINYQGQYNTFRGPDFVNAILKIDGEDMQGAVEIHKSTQDWLKHQHQEDHYYNSVILHVVLYHNSPNPWTIKENGDLVEILELQDLLSEDIQKLLQNYTDEPPGISGEYCRRLSGIDKSHMESILYQHGKMRFLAKVNRFNASLALSNFDQILYEGLMEAAGYDKNKFSLLHLAQSIPYKILQEFAHEGLNAVDMTAILLCSSGLLAKSRNRISEDIYTKILSAYEQQNCYARNISIDWQLFRIRPANHPLGRIVWLCQFLFTTMQKGLLKHTLEFIEHDTPAPKLRYKRFCQMFTTVKSELLPKSNALGKTVLNNIYINIYLPIMFLYAKKMALNNMQESLMDSYVSFGALPENYVTRHMSRHINPSQNKDANSKSIYQQGLMDIFHRYCRYHLCDNCISDTN